MWKPYNLDLFLDITTACNASCPMCVRTNVNTNKKEDWLPIIEWTLEDFTKAFPKNVAENVKQWQICGSYGDPMMNKDIVDIVKYCRENSSGNIRINTNGSLRTEDVWWDLGVAGGKKLTVEFGVEGINQKMQERYRQKTFLKKILNNMNTLSQTRAFVETQTIVFKHNQKYLNDIEEMCVKHGSIRHRNVYTDRFINRSIYSPNRFDFIDSKGNKNFLERAETKQKLRSKIIKQKKDGMETETIRRNDDLNFLEKKNITCEWGSMNKIVINPDGNVIPCCYFAPTMLPPHPPWGNKLLNLDIIQKHGKEEHNVFNKNLLDILKDSVWFNKELPESWQKNPTHICKRYCGY